MQNDVTKFRMNHDDWESLAKFLIYKQTGRRYKKTKVKQAGSQAMKEMVMKQHGGTPGVGQKLGQKEAIGAGDVLEKDVSDKEREEDDPGVLDAVSDEESDGGSDSGVDEGNMIKSIDNLKEDAGSENDSKDGRSADEGSDESENESVNKEQGKLIDSSSVNNDEIGTDKQSTEKQTTSIYEKRLKHLNIFTVKEDGEASTDEDESRSENIENDSGRSNIESDAEDVERRTSDTTDSYSEDDTSESSEDLSPDIIGEKNIAPHVVKGGNLGEGVKKTKLVCANTTKPAVGSECSKFLMKSKEKTEAKKVKTKKNASKEKELDSTGGGESWEVKQNVVKKPAKEPVNVKRGAMVIQKLNLDANDSDDIAVSSADGCESEDDVPEFLFEKDDNIKEKRESRDMFFISGDGEESEGDVSENESGDGDSSGIEDEDAETTHHRGKQMIESVFIGTLSKPDSDRKERNEGYRDFRGGWGRGGWDSFDRHEGQQGFHRGSYRDRGGHRGSFQDRGNFRDSFHDRGRHRGSFQGHDGHRGSFRGHDRERGGARGYRGSDRGSSMGRGGGRYHIEKG
jgi:hypothetical protein